MKIISTNKERAVGICTELDFKDKDLIGVWSPKMLREWAEMLEKLYGDCRVQVFLHHSSCVESHMLAASESGEEPYVCVASFEEDKPVRRED